MLLCASASALAQPSVPELLEAKTLAELRRFDAGFDGVVGVAAIDLETGRAFALNGDTVFPQASVIKIPILVAMHRAGLRFGDKVTVAPAEAVGGSGTPAICAEERARHPHRARARRRHDRGER